MRDLSRRALLAGAAAAGIAGVSACSDSADDGPDGPGQDPDGAGTPTPEPRSAVPVPPSASQSLSGDAAALAAGVSALLLESSPVAVLCTDDPMALETAAEVAAQGHWPVLIAGAELPAVTSTELSRLTVEHVIFVPGRPPAGAVPTQPTATDSPTGADGPTDAGSSPSDPPGVGVEPPVIELPAIEGVEVHVVPADAGATIPEGVPVGAAPGPVEAAVLAGVDAAAGAALATAAAFGAQTHTGLEDPREDAAVMGALRAAPEAPIVAIGADETAGERLLSTGTMAQRAPELPGGGVTMFPHRRLVALYGHPGAPVLGLLGEQGVQASIERVNTYVEKYAPLVDEMVIPAFEIIASVATGAAGPDGNYSKVWPPETFREMVDAAKEAGVYVVLDLQPGRSDFLTQAQAYEELLVEPHVGLALDPEWRLGPNEKHLVRIGHVEAEEVNRVSEWLAALVREHTLPQKILTLHQFRLSMIRGRETVRTDHPEIAIVLHADGQGGQGDKQATWRALKQDLPEGMWLGWKNFYDEDSPMLTPEQTIAQIEPTPWFISYQ